MNEETIFSNIGTQDRGITIKSPREIDAMRKAGKVVAKTLQLLCLLYTSDAADE